MKTAVPLRAVPLPSSNVPVMVTLLSGKSLVQELRLIACYVTAPAVTAGLETGTVLNVVTVPESDGKTGKAELGKTRDGALKAPSAQSTPKRAP